MNSTNRIEFFSTAETKQWYEALDLTDGFDFYHLPEYHRISESRGEGKGLLCCYRESSRVIAWPFLIRPISVVEGLEEIGSELNDLTSVYGYAGPAFSSSARSDKEFLERFGVALRKAVAELKVVSIFSRQHPLLDNSVPGIGIGSALEMGHTVSVDLTQSEDIQWSQIRKNHQTNIKKARARGVKVRHDTSWTALHEFTRLYNHTMMRVEAEETYFLDSEYFLHLRDALGDRLHLFIAEHGDQICSAGLFTKTGPFIQYLFSGSNTDCHRIAGFKLIIDEVRRWGKSEGANVLHLGGGVGCRQDSLFHFKAGFSPRRHSYFVWKYVSAPNVYQSLVHARKEWLSRNNILFHGADFFPLYRARGTRRMSFAHQVA